MTVKRTYLILVASSLLAACQPGSEAAGADMKRLQKQILARQDLLLNIHLELDSAARDISDAHLMAQDGNCSGAEFHSAEAYRRLRAADEAILDLGRDLQALFNLESAVDG